MSIVCGTDLTGNADQAAQAAAMIAGRLGVPLKLVHVLEELGAELTMASSQSSVFDPLRERVREQADRLGTQFGVEVEPVVLPGTADRTLVEVAQAAGATWIVVSSLGQHKPHRWLYGNVAEQVARISPLPVLLVRDSAGIEAWTSGERALRVMVAVELAATSKAALDWAVELREIGPADLCVTQIVRPFDEYLRLGLSPSMRLDRFRPEVEEILLRDLRAWAGELPGHGETTFQIKPGWARRDIYLSRLATEAQVDLLVVGTHQRSAVERLWQESVSSGVLQLSTSNVACIPRVAGAASDETIPTLRHVLVPTDFSPFANRAVPVAYGLAAPGGTVTLVHVLAEDADEGDAPLTERLRGLIPPGAAEKGVTTEFEIVRQSSPWKGIWHTAGRLGVDALCMATHGHSGVLRAVLGSQAQQVVQRVRQPVLLVTPDEET